MTMLLSAPGCSYPFMDDMQSQSPVRPALTNEPCQTDLQKLNKKISSTSDSYLYDIIQTHLLDFLTNVDSMRPDLTPNSPDHVLCIKISITVSIQYELVQKALQYELVQKAQFFTLSNALLTLNAIELYINLLLSNLISTIKDVNAFGKNADRWRDMKKQLIELSKFVDRIGLHYKHKNPDNTLPNIDEVVIVKDQIIHLLKKIGLSKVQKYLVRDNQCAVSFHELLASTIGLKCEIGKQVELAQTNFPGHQTDLYYLKDILRENIKSTLESSSSSASIAEILTQSGFTDSKASRLAESISANDFHRQSLVYWIDIYLEFMFKYDIFLNDTCPRFPHQEKKLNKWFKLPTEREDDDENVSNIDVYYINKSADDLDVKDKSPFLPLSQNNSNYWYHGTDHKSAEHIRKNGIQVSKGKLEQEFSDGSGFYLTPYYQDAYEWSRRFPDVSVAVLLFVCSFDNFSGIDCFGNNESEWEKIIKYFRSGKSRDERPDKSLRLLLKDRADFIHGPMSSNGSKYKPGSSWEPEKRPGNASQLCIKSDKMADQFSFELKGIIFFANP